MSGKYSYKPAYPPGNFRALHSAARKNISTGELLAKYLAQVRADLERYKAEHARTKTAAAYQSAVLAALAKKVFGSYIRYYLAAMKHGEASAAAPRRAEEFSQFAVEENIEPGFFGALMGASPTIGTTIVAGGLSIPDEREVNAIVRDNAEEAAKFGLSEGGANLGPDVNIEKINEVIAASENAGDFAGGRRRRRNRKSTHRNGRKTTRRNRKTTRRNRKSTRRAH
jgi:hypothetical protein